MDISRITKVILKNCFKKNGKMTHSKVTTVGILSGFKEFFLQHIYIYLYKCIIRVTSGYPNDTFYGILALELPKFGHLNGRAIFLLWTKDWK